MNSLHTVTSTILILLVAIRASEASYGRINDYLIKNVNDDEIASNMEAASKWLKEQDSTSHTFLSGVPISDLKKFTALQQVVDDTKCDHSSYDIIRANERAVGLHYLSDNKRVIRRVDKVMLKIFKEHAEKCQKVYPLTYSAKKQQLDGAVLKCVKRLEKSIRGSNLEWGFNSKRRFYFVITSNNLFTRYVREIPSIEKFIGEHLLHNALVKNSEGDPDAKYVRKVPDEHTGKQVVYKDKIKELAKKYLIEPCRQFEVAMGPDLFIPARFEARVINTIDDDNLDYYFGWSYFNICRALTSNEQAVFKDLIRSVTG